MRNQFDDLLVLASQSLPRELAIKLEPWDLKRLVAYQDEFLGGFVCETYSVNLEQGFATAQQLMAPAIAQTIRANIGGDHQRISTTDTRYFETTYKHVLLPVWMCAYRYRQETYRFLVNARTGEVQGERPYSAWKIALLVLCITVALATILLAIDLDVLADGGGLADDHAGAMVDEEALAELCPRVDVDAREAVGVLGHDPRQQRHVGDVELVRQALNHDGKNARVAEERLVGRAGGRVAIEGGLHVAREHAADGRDVGEELLDDAAGLAVAIGALVGVAMAGYLLAVAQAATNLVIEHVGEFHDQFADPVADVFGGQSLLAEVAGEHDRS